MSFSAEANHALQLLETAPRKLTTQVISIHLKDRVALLHYERIIKG
jgi:hypothetical protein